MSSSLGTSSASWRIQVFRVFFLLGYKLSEGKDSACYVHHSAQCLAWNVGSP